MNILFKEKGVRLIQGDGLEVLKEIPDECIDMIFADIIHLSTESVII